MCVCVCAGAVVVSPESVFQPDSPLFCFLSFVCVVAYITCHLTHQTSVVCLLSHGYSSLRDWDLIIFSIQAQDYIVMSQDYCHGVNNKAVVVQPRASVLNLKPKTFGRHLGSFTPVIVSLQLVKHYTSFIRFSLVAEKVVLRLSCCNVA